MENLRKLKEIAQEFINTFNEIEEFDKLPQLEVGNVYISNETGIPILIKYSDSSFTEGYSIKENLMIKYSFLNTKEYRMASIPEKGEFFDELLSKFNVKWDTRSKELLNVKFWRINKGELVLMLDSISNKWIISEISSHDDHSAIIGGSKYDLDCFDNDMIPLCTETFHLVGTSVNPTNYYIIET